MDEIICFHNTFIPPTVYEHLLKLLTFIFFHCYNKENNHNHCTSFHQQYKYSAHKQHHFTIFIVLYYKTFVYATIFHKFNHQAFIVK